MAASGLLREQTATAAKQLTEAAPHKPIHALWLTPDAGGSQLALVVIESSRVWMRRHVLLIEVPCAELDEETSVAVELRCLRTYGGSGAIRRSGAGRSGRRQSRAVAGEQQAVLRSVQDVGGRLDPGACVGGLEPVALAGRTKQTFTSVMTLALMLMSAQYGLVVAHPVRGHLCSSPYSTVS